MKHRLLFSPVVDTEKWEPQDSWAVCKNQNLKLMKCSTKLSSSPEQIFEQSNKILAKFLERV